MFAIEISFQLKRKLIYRNKLSSAKIVKSQSTFNNQKYTNIHVPIKLRINYAKNVPIENISTYFIYWLTLKFWRNEIYRWLEIKKNDCSDIKIRYAEITIESWYIYQSMVKVIQQMTGWGYVHSL